MSSELLKRAAAKLRETAAMATPAPWAASIHPELGPCASDPTLSLCVQVEDGWVGEADLKWIALASPAIAEPLALWLDQAASAYDNLVATDCGPAAVLIYAEAMTVARAILGEVTE